MNFRLLVCGPELLCAVVVSEIVNCVHRDYFCKLFSPNFNHPCRIDQNTVASCEDGRKTVS